MPRIALVEDNPDNQMLIEVLVEDLEGEFELDQYVDGPSALAGILASPPDVVLLDISLPGMDGVAVLQELRASRVAHLPVVALTAHAMEGDRERFLEAGFDAYVAKPILDEDLLFDAVRELLGRTREAAP